MFVEMIAQAAGSSCASCGLLGRLAGCPYALAGIGLLAGLAAGFALGRAGRRRGGRGRAGAGGGAPDGRALVEIYVGNLSYDMTEAQMRKEFEKFGEVFSARIISNRFNNKSKGFGFVEMPNRPEAEAAIKALNDKEIQGRKLRVNEAKNKSHE